MAEDQPQAKSSGYKEMSILTCFLESTTCLGKKENKRWPLTPINQKYIYFHVCESLNTAGKE